MRFLLALLTLIPFASAMAEDRPAHGLMWNRTGLPAVFPLQVKTNQGNDFLMTLSDTATGTDALAAFIEGGQFFRVLVPPGTYEVRFEYGGLWNGDENRFADPQILELEEPLTFSVQGIGRKTGHLVDLTALPDDSETAFAPRLKSQTLCQVTVVTIQPNCLISNEDCTVPDLPDRYVSPYARPPAFEFTLDSYSQFCD